MTSLEKACHTFFLTTEARAGEQVTILFYIGDDIVQISNFLLKNIIMLKTSCIFAKFSLCFDVFKVEKYLFLLL